MLKGSGLAHYFTSLKNERSLYQLKVFHGKSCEKHRFFLFFFFLDC